MLVIALTFLHSYCHVDTKLPSYVMGYKSFIMSENKTANAQQSSSSPLHQKLHIDFEPVIAG